MKQKALAVLASLGLRVAFGLAAFRAKVNDWLRPQ